MAHPGLHRSELRRRGTSLRMEGDFAGSTEKAEQFVEWPRDSLRRAEPVRPHEQLRLEGELAASTECHDSYVPFVGARRPELLRQPAHLRLEGPATWTPEYADVFKCYSHVGTLAWQSNFIRAGVSDRGSMGIFSVVSPLHVWKAFF